ncbi:decaprenyl-phosphate phosphoribosyltransferase [candidate division KSB1 bacterium]|nr:decaprenyl-phosphate phosphoribosyltransferase [candidate division KSB1 bacterium]
MKQNCLNYLKALRPQQWSKNLLLFAGIVFSHNLLVPGRMLRALAAFVIFCLLSGAIYLVNDLFDIEEDRQHPLKRQRPLAAGAISKMQATLFALMLLLLCTGSAFVLHHCFGMVAALYALSLIAYSAYLKRVVILDVIIISAGFVLRAAAGAIVINVVISPWLLACTFFMALFLALAKRRHELTFHGVTENCRRTSLTEYSPLLLDQMIAIVTASTMVSYALYTMAPRTIEVAGTHYLIITLPFVVFGIFRYLYLVYRENQGGNPEMIIFSDKPLFIDVILWIIVIILILYM